MNQDLKVYEEVEIPPPSLYKAVGYNDMTVVKTIMEGDDSDKRSEAKKRESMAVERTHTAIQRDAAQADLEAKAEEARITNVTNLHYRKFYEDELENDRDLFPDPDEPFIKIPIKRG